MLPCFHPCRRCCREPVLLRDLPLPIFHRVRGEMGVPAPATAAASPPAPAALLLLAGPRPAMRLRRLARHPAVHSAGVPPYRSLRACHSSARRWSRCWEEKRSGRLQPKPTTVRGVPARLLAGPACGCLLLPLRDAAWPAAYSLSTAPLCCSLPPHAPQPPAHGVACPSAPAALLCRRPLPRVRLQQGVLPRGADSIGGRARHALPALRRLRQHLAGGLTLSSG